MNSDNQNLDQFNEHDQDATVQSAESNLQSEQNDQSLKCLAELSMWQDQCKRISAEFENFKRRIDRDKIRWAEIANEGILLELLSFMDTFETALKHKADDKGIEMVYQSLKKLLSKYGVTEMSESVDFNPEYHEAVMQVPSESHVSGQIVQILSKGFLIKDRVLRPAKVSVAV
jgi:molecular chaperone GrpE